MKRIMEYFIICALPVLLPALSHSEEVQTKKMTLEFSSPGKPGIVKVVSGEGNVTVTGYDGNNVAMEVRSSEEISDTGKVNEKAKGMKRISSSGFNVTKDAETNTIIISRSMKSETNIMLKVPRLTSLNIGGQSDAKQPVGVNGIAEMVMKSVAGLTNYSGGLFQGNIEISGVQGDIEVNTMEGDITVKDVTSNVVANNLDGNITVTYKSLTSKNPIAFSSIDGDIDVTFPAGLKATVTARNVDGDIFTDFDMDMNASEPPSTGSKKPSKTSGITIAQSGSQNIDIMGMFGTNVIGNINGGGTEISMTTIDGDIYIRKGK
ncbi:DUF4097 family beta strand repeat-containing protein [Candidatus Latescibacterota bacterium]